MTDTRVYSVLTQVMPPLAASRPGRPRRSRLREVVLYDLGPVERFLDWLEATGHTHRKLSIVGKAFVVRWR